jgi:Xaa-Pro aminopeptidase
VSGVDHPNLDNRIHRVRAELVATECDAMIVTSLVNIRWLTGFTGSNATVVISTDHLVLLTDGRYKVQGAQQLEQSKSAAEIRIAASGPDGEITSLLGGMKRVGLESANISWLRQGQIAERLHNVELVPLTSLIEGLRQIKDSYELHCLERAANIADAAFAETYPLLISPNGITEAVFARALESAMDRLGSEEPSFETIVASGPNSGLPHARPGSRIIEVGDLVVIDFGAKLGGYGSDMTRTVLAGAGKPTAAQADLYEAVQRAQQAGVDAVMAGVPEASIDSVCRSVLNEAGYGEHFVHSTGHSLGLEIHEQPILSSRATGILKTGLVVTVEPGAYPPELGGVRVEDCVLVTESGCRPLTHSPKGLVPLF